jgi:hypothetical protein
VHNRGATIVGDVRREPGNQTFHGVNAFSLGCAVLRRPPVHLSRHVIAGPSEVAESGGAPIDVMKARQRLAHRVINGSPIVWCAIGKGRVRHGMTLHVVHDKKRRADDIGVFTQKMGLRNWHAGTMQRGHHLVFTFNGVRRRQQGAGWFASKDQTSR